MRYPRGQGPGVTPVAEMTPLPVGKAQVRRTGKSGLLILAFGAMVKPAEIIAERIDATVVNMRFVKPLDEELVIRLAGTHSALVEARGGRFAVESYLDHHADKLVRRFDAGSYVTLTQSMNAHDVGRGRGGVAAALKRVTARSVIAGVDSDRLYPLYQAESLAEGLGGEAAVISSPYGHDSFLIETDQIAALVKSLLG